MIALQAAASLQGSLAVHPVVRLPSWLQAGQVPQCLAMVLAPFLVALAVVDYNESTHYCFVTMKRMLQRRRVMQITSHRTLHPRRGFMLILLENHALCSSHCGNAAVCALNEHRKQTKKYGTHER